MVTPTVGEVVLVPFPFSDLSQAKVRPALCLADAGRGDWVLCQITSNPYGDRGGTARRSGLRVGRIARGQLCPTGQTFFSSRGVDSPLSRGAHPDCVRAGAVYSRRDTPTAHGPLMPNKTLALTGPPYWFREETTMKTTEQFV